ncbi:MAG: sulfotransferase [Thermoanaerobaculia bacterium]
MSGPLRARPIVIIGAGRSGTNILRDVLTGIPGFGTWPCDEINYIWRHGNVRHPDDELTADQVTPRIRSYIRGAFDHIAERGRLDHVVEKTCANSLRVGFVDAVLPEARFINIVRDGRDVVASAKLRWTAPLDLPYLAKKARWVPLTDLPWYASRYLWNRAYRLFSREKRLAFWGPRFAGLDDALARYELEEVCALQWKRCVDRSDADLGRIDPERLHAISYETFARDPEHELSRLADFLGVDIPDAQRNQLAASVSPRSVGKWRRDLDVDTVKKIEVIAGETLRTHGYF